VLEQACSTVVTHFAFHIALVIASAQAAEGDTATAMILEAHEFLCWFAAVVLEDSINHS